MLVVFPNYICLVIAVVALLGGQSQAFFFGGAGGGGSGSCGCSASPACPPVQACAPVRLLRVFLKSAATIPPLPTSQAVINKTILNNSHRRMFNLLNNNILLMPLHLIPTQQQQHVAPPQPIAQPQYHVQPPQQYVAQPPAPAPTYVAAPPQAPLPPQTYVANVAQLPQGPPPPVAVQVPSYAQGGQAAAGERLQEVIEDVDSLQSTTTASEAELNNSKATLNESLSSDNLSDPIAISLLKLTNDTECNSEELRKIILENMDEDLNSSKRVIQLAAEAKFGGRFDVICSSNDFSYVTNTEVYCQETKSTVSCYAYRQL
uniref:Ground-like domain-containing protein n=1 Tax=Ditylenchus dipsaci TaxID=166011 RepID=A0A915CTB6_9BILA